MMSYQIVNFQQLWCMYTNIYYYKVHCATINDRLLKIYKTAQKKRKKNLIKKYFYVIFSIKFRNIGKLCVMYIVQCCIICIDF